MQCFRGSNILNLPPSISWNKAMVFCTKDDELKVKSMVEWGFRDLFSMTSLGFEFAIEKLKFILHIRRSTRNLTIFETNRPDPHLTKWYLHWTVLDYLGIWSFTTADSYLKYRLNLKNGKISIEASFLKKTIWLRKKIRTCAPKVASA